MGIFLLWLSANWFVLLQTLGITGGLGFTAYNLMINSRLRKIDTMISLTAHHRAIWLKFLDKPELKGVLRQNRDLQRHPITEEEMIFVNLIILHMATALAAERTGVFKGFAGQNADIKEFFSLPTVKSVWESTKVFRDPETILYIESLLPA